MFMFMMCFQCVNGFIYSILYTRITMYCVLQHSQGPTLSCQRRVIWNVELSWWCCPWCLTLTVSLHIVVTLGWAVSIYSCSLRCAERVLQRHMTLLFRFLVEQQNFCMTSTEQNNVTSEISVWDKCHKCNINCHIAVHPCVPPPRISTDTQRSRCQNGLSARSHDDLERWHHPSFNTHTKSCSLKLHNPMHLSLCNMCSCLWCSSAICRENPVIAIQYSSFYKTFDPMNIPV